MKYGDSLYHIFTSEYNYTILSGENQVLEQRFSNCSQKGSKGAEKGLFSEAIFLHWEYHTQTECSIFYLGEL